MQKAIIIQSQLSGNWSEATQELNDYLSKGWKVVTMSPMGAFGYSGNGAEFSSSHGQKSGFASLVLIQKD